jgi:Glycosyl hydrolase family 30 beta sandwich domain
LLDVLDTHWYPAAGTSGGEINNDYAPQDDAMVQARVQAPRSLWDPTYNEGSWVSGVTSGPIRLIPRLKDQIAAHYPGTRIAITEYYYGRGGDVSGGIAQADVLGIFGREGVYAATLWPQAGIWANPYGGDGRRAYAFAFGAFRMFRNYDGAGGRFGDTGLRATTTDVAASSVYASRDPNGNIVLVVINKSNAVKVTNIALQGASGLATARTYVMSAASADPVRGANAAVFAGSTVTYSMPAMSVTTIVVAP